MFTFLAKIGTILTIFRSTGKKNLNFHNRPATAKLSNRKWILKAHPQGKFQASRDAELVKEKLDLNSIPEDKVVIEVHALSIDAFIRTMLDGKDNTVHRGKGLGEPIPALGYGKVIRGNKKFATGSMVTGMVHAAIYAVTSGDGLQAQMKLPRTEAKDSLGILGVSGIAAYIGVFCSPSKCPQKGDTVVVSAAAGAVGCIAAQMAKLCGARVVGVAGGSLKRKFLMEDLKLDEAVDYKDDSKTIGEQLDLVCPDGIDFFFDNVGGDILDEVLQRINLHSRVVICGAISHYDSGNINQKKKICGPSHYIKVAETSSTISGFNMAHYTTYFLQAFRYLAWHYYRGNIVCPSHVEKGINTFGDSLEKLFAGGHYGRLIVDVCSDQS